MNLAEGQQLFWQMLERRADEGVLAKIFQASKEVPLCERARVYADAYVWRQVEALREDFPLMKAHLGCDAFDALSQAFVYTHPSRHPSLAKRGNGFAEFVAERDAKLGELAALEWARTLIFDAPESETATIAVLQQPGVELACLRMIPALSVITLAYPVVDWWRALSQQTALPAVAPATEHVVVWRSQDIVYHAVAEADEAAAMRGAMSGQTIAQMCNSFAEHKDPAQRAGGVLSRWFAEGMVAGLVSR